MRPPSTPSPAAQVSAERSEASAERAADARSLEALTGELFQGLPPVRTLDEILTALFKVLGSSRAETLLKLVRGSRRTAAVSLMTSLGLTPEEAQQAYAHYAVVWRPQTVKLVEVPRDDWDRLRGTPWDVYERLRDRGEAPPRFLVRIGMDLMNAMLMERENAIQEFVTGQGMARINEVDQIWRVIPRHEGSAPHV